MAGTTRFDFYPSDFLNGIMGLTAEEIAVYTVVMVLHYDRGEPIQYVGGGGDRELCARLGMNVRRLNRVVNQLVSAGKLKWFSTGLGNQRACDELEKFGETLAKLRANSSKGGNSTRAKWDGLSKENKGHRGPDTRPNTRPNGPPFLLPSTKKGEELHIDSTNSSEIVDSARARAKPNRKNQIDENYQPTGLDERSAEEAGMSPATFRHEWGQFRAHHIARASAFANWQQAWRTWVGNWTKFGKQQIGTAAGLNGGGGGKRSIGLAMMEQWAENYAEPIEPAFDLDLQPNKTD